MRKDKEISEVEMVLEEEWATELVCELSSDLGHGCSSQAVVSNPASTIWSLTLDKL